MAKRISILGCGWLGLPLGRHLARAGWAVLGSTTQPEGVPALKAAGIQPFVLRLDPREGVVGESADPRAFFDTEVLFLNIPPGRRQPDVEERFPRQVAAAADATEEAGTPWLVFASSTSVYPSLNRTVREADAGGPGLSASGRALVAAEGDLNGRAALATTVLRFGGLYGYDRQPGRFLAGRSGVSGPEAPVNLIHRDDCVGIVEAVLSGQARGETFNAVADEHPTRRALYVAKAREGGFEPPSFSDEPADWKRVSNEHLKRTLGYRFIHPDPLAPAP